MANEPSNGPEVAEDAESGNRFERLTRQLLAVPKREVDEAVKKAKRERSRRQQRRSA